MQVCSKDVTTTCQIWWHCYSMWYKRKFNFILHWSQVTDRAGCRAEVGRTRPGVEVEVVSFKPSRTCDGDTCQAPVGCRVDGVSYTEGQEFHLGCEQCVCLPTGNIHCRYIPYLIHVSRVHMAWCTCKYLYKKSVFWIIFDWKLLLLKSLTTPLQFILKY